MEVIMKKICISIVLCCFFAISMTCHANDKGSNYFTKPFWNIDKTYRVKYDIDNILEENGNCSSPGTKFKVGRKSIFKEVYSKEKEKILTFDYINDAGATLPNTKTPYKLCIDDTTNYKYKRAGGIDTGILVVPFKVRSGDLFGDSTLGPYIALKGESISLLATFGLTQVSVTDLTTKDVKSESGLSYAIGTIWSVTDDFDLGLVVGRDHLSGSAGDNFKFQDKTWWSFAIGYNFTTK